MGFAEFYFLISVNKSRAVANLTALRIFLTEFNQSDKEGIQFLKEAVQKKMKALNC